MTPEQIQEQAEKYANEYQDAFIEGAKWMQEQEKWISVEDMSVDVADRLANTDLKLIQCLFDNGEILTMNDKHPFAKLTHVYFLVFL